MMSRATDDHAKRDVRVLTEASAFDPRFPLKN